MFLLSRGYAGQGIQAAYRENHDQEDTSMLEYLKQFRSPQPKKRRIGITHSARADSFFWSGLNHTVVLTLIAEEK
jgi:hypothetical protein